MEDSAPPSTALSSSTIAQETVTCPHCGPTLAIETPTEQQLIVCPTCQMEFLLGGTDETEQGDSVSGAPAEPEIELDGFRIRQLVQLRRSSIRARTYAIIIMLCCLIMGVQLVLTDIQEVHSYGWDRWAILYVIFAVLMALGAAISSRKAGVLHRESKISAAASAEPEYVPQFDDLGDGSQRVKNLEEMQIGDFRTQNEE